MIISYLNYFNLAIIKIVYESYFHEIKIFQYAIRK